MKKILYLDFDGVLHDDAVYYHPKRGIYLDAPNHELFEWAYILEELLTPFPDWSIVLSTSWVRFRSFEFAISRLPQGLKDRVIGATFSHHEIQKLDFDMQSRGNQILADVKRRQPDSWFAIDNDANGWPLQYIDRLVLTKDRLGVSEQSVQEIILEMLSQGIPN